jgi:hypothetical protein
MQDTPTVAPVWVTVAAVILAIQGINTIFYAGFLPPPGGIDAGLDVPVLGHLPLVWLALGVLDLVAAAGVYLRRRWGRILGVVAVVASMALVVSISGSPGSLAAVGLVFPIFVLFALWRRWP